MEVKTIEKSFSIVLSVLLIVLCLAIENKSQIEAAASGTRRETSSMLKRDLLHWQTVLLKGKGIKLKLPPDWRHDESDLEKKTENFILEEIDWSSPNKELIRVFITTYPNGFISLNRTASKEQLLREEFDRVTHTRDPLYSDIKRLKLNGVEGVFKLLWFDFKNKDIGVRTGPIWTGYRIYQGKAQEIQFNMSSSPQGDELLRAIFNTIEIDQDKRQTRSVKSIR
jgi:hypothetical protein